MIYHSVSGIEWSGLLKLTLYRWCCLSAAWRFCLAAVSRLLEHTIAFLILFVQGCGGNEAVVDNGKDTFAFNPLALLIFQTSRINGTSWAHTKEGKCRVYRQ